MLVLWGDSDRIVTPGYGQAMAASFPQAQFAVIGQAGHLPQLEQPDATFGVLDAFIGKNPGRPGSLMPCTIPSWSLTTSVSPAMAGAENPRPGTARCPGPGRCPRPVRPDGAGDAPAFTM